MKASVGPGYASDDSGMMQESLRLAHTYGNKRIRFAWEHLCCVEGGKHDAD